MSTPRNLVSSSRAVSSFLAALLLVLLVTQTEPARATTGDLLALSHKPPSVATAGRQLRIEAAVTTGCAVACAPVTLIAHYSSPEGEELSESKTGSGKDQESIGVTIPAEHVRFPGFSYWLEASVADGEGTAKSLRKPILGSYSVPVENVVTFSLRDPDGSDAKGVRVIASLAETGLAWETKSDDKGMVSFTVPASDPRIKAIAEKNRSVMLHFRAYDRWPTDPPNQPRVTMPVNGELLTALINLGDPVLPAVDEGVQDKVFPLQPQEMTFTSEPECDVNMDWLVTKMVCVTRLGTIYDVPEPMAVNIGGGVETAAQFKVTISQLHRSTFARKTGTEWFASTTEEVAENNSKQEATTRTVGPMENVTVMGDFNWVHKRINVCPSSGWCSEEETKDPETWTDSDDVNFPSADKHDTATKMTMTPGSDCVYGLNQAERKSEEGFSGSMKYETDIGGTIPTKIKLVANWPTRKRTPQVSRTRSPGNARGRPTLSTTAS